MALRPDEEVDDGYTRESWERAEEDTGDEGDGEEDELRQWPSARAAFGLDPSYLYSTQEMLDFIHEYNRQNEEDRAARFALKCVQTYNDELNRLEIAPNGDDYNALLDILAGKPVGLPHTEGR